MKAKLSPIVSWEYHFQEMIHIIIIYRTATISALPLTSLYTQETFHFELNHIPLRLYQKDSSKNLLLASIQTWIE